MIEIILTQTNAADDSWQSHIADEWDWVLDGQYREYDLERDGNANEPDSYSREDRLWPFTNMDQERNPQI